MFYDIGDPNYLFGDAISEWLMFKQLGSFNTVSFPVYKLTWGLVHWNIVQNIEIFCKRNESLIKWWCCGPVTIFWCWPSFIDWIFIMTLWRSWMWLVTGLSLAGSEGTSSSHRGHEWQPSLTVTCFTNISLRHKVEWKWQHCPWITI